MIDVCEVRDGRVVMSKQLFDEALEILIAQGFTPTPFNVGRMTAQSLVASLMLECQDEQDMIWLDRIRQRITGGFYSQGTAFQSN